ncbi:uncharacterized protein LY89DRAFT_542659, partial [Mollisia scopiformis]
QTEEQKELMWGKGACIQLCEDAFNRSDAIMVRSCGVEKYCVLVATPVGVGLYRKEGFKVVKEMEFDLEMYTGGQGKGETKRWVMRR